MLDTLKALWNPEESLSRIGGVISALLDILSHFEEDKLKEGSSRDAAIDIIIQILQQEKTKL